MSTTTKLAHEYQVLVESWLERKPTLTVACRLHFIRATNKIEIEQDYQHFYTFLKKNREKNSRKMKLYGRQNIKLQLRYHRLSTATRPMAFTVFSALLKMELTEIKKYFRSDVCGTVWLALAYLVFHSYGCYVREIRGRREVGREGQRENENCAGEGSKGTKGGKQPIKMRPC